MKKTSILFLFFFICTGIVYADVRLPAIFSDNMILQREMKVPVWGWADPGEKVVVKLGKHSSKTKAGANGKWKLYIGPLESGGPFKLIISGKNKISINNVLVGEVWVCSGQSNMAMKVAKSNNAKEEIASANFPQIRHFQVNKARAAEPLEEVNPNIRNENYWLNTWEECDSTNVGRFTATGYYFIRKIYQELNVPVGIISTSWGGTVAEAWTPHDTLANDPQLKPILDDWLAYTNNIEWLRKAYANYLKDIEEGNKQTKEESVFFNSPSALYNGMIAPIIPYGIRGVTWYQGESNETRARQYRSLFPAMIDSWRKKWGQGDFPFLFVQLANFMQPANQPEDANWAELREAQTMALNRLPNTGMAVIIDIGEADDVHPKNKQDVGKRLALSALKIAYNQDIVYSSPMYESMEITGNKIRIKFKETGSGLMAKNQYGYVNGFAVAGADKKFYWAKASIENENTVVLICNEVTKPVAVRYAWANNPKDVNLYNKEGLPAAPFRTDNWPGISYWDK